MKRNLKALALCGVLSATTLFSACSGLGEKTEYRDPNKTQLYVGVMEGGLGEEWIKEIAANYTAAHPDVEIVLPTEKDLYNNTNLLNSISTSSVDMYLVNDIYLRDFVSKGYVMDLSEIMNDTTDGASIASRVRDDTIKSLYTIDGKYYASPYYIASFGSVYDIDLFEDKNLYFNESGTNFVTSKTEKRSVGPDGKAGTSDDGLPATYSQYAKLLEQMRQKGVRAYTWSGKDVYYRRRLLTTFWADYEGIADWNLNNTFSGTDSTLGAITPATAVTLQSQKGKEYATQFAYDLMSNAKNYSGNAFGPSQTHIMAQDEFLTSTTTSSPIAMIAEGGWWENEARSTFNDMAVNNEEHAYGTRRFGLMPVPKADDGTSNARRTVMFGGTRSCVIINEKTTQKDLAVDFFKFLHSEESMRIFTKHTGCIRPFNYTITEAEYNMLTPFQQETYDLSKSSDVDFAYLDGTADNEFLLNNSAYFNNWDWKSQVSSTYSDPITAFYNSNSLTVAEYVAGMTAAYANWPQA